MKDGQVSWLTARPRGCLPCNKNTISSFDGWNSSPGCGWSNNHCIHSTSHQWRSHGLRGRVLTVTAKGAITSKIKHAMKHKTSPARLAQLLQPSLASSFSLQPMTVYRPATVVQVLQDLFYVLLHVLLDLFNCLVTNLTVSIEIGITRVTTLQSSSNSPTFPGIFIGV